MKDFLKRFELYLGSVFISVTVAVVIMNVFTRYFLRFTYFWAEEVAVGCFVWTIFLGTAAAYRQKALIGVEAIVVLLPGRIRKVVEFFAFLLLVTVNSIMFYFSLTYVLGSSKITSALEISYSYINSGIVVSFALMTLYSVMHAVECCRELKAGKLYEEIEK